MASIPYFLLRTYNSVKNIPTISAIGHMPWRMNRYRKTINHHTWKSYLKHHQLKDFSVFGEIAEIKSQFLLGTSLCLYHLNLVILANTMISLIFCKFFEKLQKLQKWQFLLGTLLPPLTLVLILARSVICPIFRNFWRNHRTCRNRSFCWTPFYLF